MGTYISKKQTTTEQSRRGIGRMAWQGGHACVCACAQGKVPDTARKAPVATSQLFAEDGMKENADPMTKEERKREREEEKKEAEARASVSVQGKPGLPECTATPIPFATSCRGLGCTVTTTRKPMCIDMCTEICMDMCVDMGTDMCMDMCICTSTDMRTSAGGEPILPGRCRWCWR